MFSRYKEVIKDIIKFIDDDIYNIILQRTFQPVVTLDSTDHIYFKCRNCGAGLVLQKIGIETFMESKGEKVKVKFHFICPECGTLYYTKHYQPNGYSLDVKKNTEKLFVEGVKKGWIVMYFENILGHVRGNNYSESALRDVALSRKKFAWFERLFKQANEGKK